MRFRRYSSATGSRLVAEAPDGTDDLTAAKPSLTSFSELARAASITDVGVDEVAERLLDRAPTFEGGDTPDRPELDEVWAAGVTYEISERARESESGRSDVYLDVYEGERPEIFFKATPSRTVGHGEAVGIRADSAWNVPEPELGAVLYGGEVVGYTVGNDVSSRSIEGSNPLYLPQAKVYGRCCAIGPCVASPETVGDPHDLAVTMTGARDDDVAFAGSTSTREMVRTCEELVDWYPRHNAVPELAVLLTGTSIVPPDEFTLREGDSVRIDAEAIGTLENAVVTV